MRLLTAAGTAPLALAVVALVAGALALATRPGGGQRPDLVFALFSKEHRQAYEQVLPDWQRRTGKTVQVQTLEIRALQGRLQAALQAGAPVPDVVELCEPSIGYFTAGPLEDCGLLDLTERVDRAGLRERLVASRFGLWSSRGRIFAIPHDCHPVALIYRRDLFEQFGIRVEDLDTWDRFLAAGRRIVAASTHDGVTDHYLIDLPTDGNFGLQVMLWQRGGAYFDRDGRVAFDSDIAVDTVCWLARATRGPGRISFAAGWGQGLAKAVSDGLALCYIAPDWRTKQFELDVPQLAGKLGLMPLPAWTAGGARTSTWGSTGIAITRGCRDPDLAWQLIEELYLRTDTYGARFASSNILPPLRAAWGLPELQRPSAFWGGQSVGAFFAGLAPEVPAVTTTAYEELARTKLNEAFLRVAMHYEAAGEADLETTARAELKASADQVRAVLGRNRFLAGDAP